MNKLGIVLFIIMKIIAMNKNFSATYSFIKNEAIILFNFLFNNFRDFIFSDKIAEVRVILAN